MREPHNSRRRTAIHEAGHATAMWLSVYVVRVVEARLEPAGGTRAGAVFIEERRNHLMLSDGALWDRMVYGLAGLAAELGMFGTMHATGASADLTMVRDIAIILAARELPGKPSAPPWEDAPSPQGQEFDVARVFKAPPAPRVRDMLNVAYRRARAIMRSHGSRMMQVADALQDEGSLDEAGLREILGDRPFALFGRRST